MPTKGKYEGKAIYQKKTQKTPGREIEKAMRIMQEYFDYKKKKDRK
jgi:phage-related protein